MIALLAQLTGYGAASLAGVALVANVYRKGTK